MGFDNSNNSVSKSEKTIVTEIVKKSKKLRIEDLKPKVLTAKELDEMKIPSYALSF